MRAAFGQRVGVGPAVVTGCDVAGCDGFTEDGSALGGVDEAGELGACDGLSVVAGLLGGAELAGSLGDWDGLVSGGDEGSGFLVVGGFDGLWPGQCGRDDGLGLGEAPDGTDDGPQLAAGLLAGALGVLAGVLDGVWLGLGVGADDGDGLALGDGWPTVTVFIFDRSTITALPLSQAIGSVNWPSAITSKCRWQPVE